VIMGLTLVTDYDTNVHPARRGRLSRGHFRRTEQGRRPRAEPMHSVPGRLWATARPALGPVSAERGRLVTGRSGYRPPRRVSGSTGTGAEPMADAFALARAAAERRKASAPERAAAS